jgi:hypothetical protein
MPPNKVRKMEKMTCHPSSVASLVMTTTTSDCTCPRDKQGFQKHAAAYGIGLFNFFSFVYSTGIYLLASFNALIGGEADNY